MTVCARRPTGEPFWGGTYFPKQQFLQRARRARRRVAQPSRRPRAERDGAGRRPSAQRRRPSPGRRARARRSVNTALQRLAGAFDPEWGGFGTAPKFPSTFHLELVLRAYMTSAADDAQRRRHHDARRDGVGRACTTTSAAVSPATRSTASGSCRTSRRCSTTRRCSCASTARRYSCSASTAIAQVVEETIEYVLRDLRHPDGGFYSAEDADSPDEHGHGHEGLFHTWTPDEVARGARRLAGDDVDAVLEWFGITAERQLRGPLDPQPAPRTAASSRGRRTIEHARRLLFEAREQRRRPGLDDKVLTEWNALFLWALADAAAAFQRDDWKARRRSPTASSCCASCATTNGRWRRSLAGRRRTRRRATPALAADHAALVLAFQRLGRADRRGALGRRPRWRPPTRCSTGSGIRSTAGCTPPPRTPRGWSSARRTCSTTPRRRPTRLAADGAAATRRAHRRAALPQPRRPHPAAARQRSIDAVPGRGLERRARRSRPAARGLIELAIVGDAPELVRLAQMLWRPDLVLAWGEPFDSPLWEGRARRLRLPLPRLRVPGARVGTRTALRADHWPPAA